MANYLITSISKLIRFFMPTPYDLPFRSNLPMLRVRRPAPNTPYQGRFPYHPYGLYGRRLPARSMNRPHNPKATDGTQRIIHSVHWQYHTDPMLQNRFVSHQDLPYAVFSPNQRSDQLIPHNKEMSRNIQVLLPVG